MAYRNRINVREFARRAGARDQAVIVRFGPYSGADVDQDVAFFLADQDYWVVNAQSIVTAKGSGTHLSALVNVLPGDAPNGGNNILGALAIRPSTMTNHTVLDLSGQLGVRTSGIWHSLLRKGSRIGQFTASGTTTGIVGLMVQLTLMPFGPNHRQLLAEV